MARKVNLVGKGEGGRGPVFFILIAFMIFALYSGIIAWKTLDKCGDENSAKSWRIYPPGWVCER